MKTETLLETKFLSVVDLQVKEGSHYYVATRKKPGEIEALKTAEAVKASAADAVTCFVVETGDDPKLLLQYEFRYPIGQFVLSPPAGLIDARDKEKPQPALSAAKREIKEECGLDVKPEKLKLLCGKAFCTAGLSDESNALVAAEAEYIDIASLNHDGAEKTELFGEFVLLNKVQAKKILSDGVDPKGMYMPLHTMQALQYFLLNY